MAALVRTGLHIDHFETFDTRESDFTFSGSVWFEADPRRVALDSLNKFNFESGKIIEQSDADTQIVDGKLLVRHAVKATITRPMDHTLFPLDAHRFFIAIAHHNISPEDVALVSSAQDFVADAPLRMFGWRKVGKSVETGVKRITISTHGQARSDDYPVALYSIDIARSGIQFLLLILLPLLFIFYLSLFTLSTAQQTVGITASVMVAIPGYRIVIQNIAPSVGYLILSDYLFFIFLAAASATFLVSIVTSSSSKFTVRHREIAITLIHAAVLIACAYLFEGWQ